MGPYGWGLRVPHLQGMTFSRRAIFWMTLALGVTFGCLASWLARSF
jgi:hypothetical protein